MPPTAFVRAYRADEQQVSDDGPISFVASSEIEARDGFSIAHDAWDLRDFNKNPIFIWCHKYDSPPLGRVKAKIDKDAKVLRADVEFDMADEFAASIARKYREGYLNAVSVGFDIDAINGEAVDPTAWIFPKKGSTVTKASLLELSGVPVPADPKALAERQARGLSFDGLLDLTPERIADAIAQRLDANRAGPIAPNVGGPKAEPDAAWDEPAELVKASETPEVLRAMHAYLNPAGNPADVASYRFLHHGAEGTVNLNACQLQLARLDRADIPDADKPAVRAHLEAHVREFGAEPPERSDPAAEVVWPGTALLMARLFLDTTDDAEDAERKQRYRQLERLYRRTNHEPPEFLPRAELCLLGDEEIRGLFLAGEGDLLGWEPDGERKGAVLSARNRGDLEQAIALVRGVLDRAEKDAAEEEKRAFLAQFDVGRADTPFLDLLKATG